MRSISWRTDRPEMENAGVSKNVVADIVGHEDTTMTYGLFSGVRAYRWLIA
jgi:hypothetical protein